MKRLLLLCAASLSFLPMLPAAIKRDPAEVLRASQEAFEKRDFDKATELLTEAIEANPKLAPAYVLRGLAHAAKERHDKAIEDFTKAYELVPDDERALLLRAATYQEKKDFDHAIQDFTGVLRKKPDDGAVYISRGLCYAQKDEDDKALEDFNQAVKLDPKNVQALQLRGSAFSQKGEKEKALTDFKEAISADPNNAGTYLFRAQLYLLENEPELALADYEEVMRRAPGYAGALNDYAWTLATNPKDSVRDGRKAVDYAKKACHESDYKHAPTLDTLAAAHAEAGDWTNAVKWQEEAVRQAEGKFPDDVAGMKERLELYKEKKPFRELPKREKKAKL
jgi:tetratricopeptide (TPR) repeat protein